MIILEIRLNKTNPCYVMVFLKWSQKHFCSNLSNGNQKIEIDKVVQKRFIGIPR